MQQQQFISIAVYIDGIASKKNDSKNNINRSNNLQVGNLFLFHRKGHKHVEIYA